MKNHAVMLPVHSFSAADDAGGDCMSRGLTLYTCGTGTKYTWIQRLRIIVFFQCYSVFCMEMMDIYE